MKKLMDLICKFNEARGWKKYHDPRSLVLALCGEAGELAQFFRWRRNSSRRLSPSAKLDVEGEIADVLIFLLTLCIELDIDPENVVIEKLKINNNRFQISRRN